jgi:hypothetical protein
MCYLKCHLCDQIVLSRAATVQLQDDVIRTLCTLFGAH